MIDIFGIKARREINLLRAKCASREELIQWAMGKMSQSKPAHGLQTNEHNLKVMMRRASRLQADHPEIYKIYFGKDSKR